MRPFIERGDFRMLQYGDYSDRHSLKPTLVLTNCVAWLPKPMVLRKSVVHWDWDRLSKKRRTVIPRAVCAEIAQVCCQIVVTGELVEGSKKVDYLANLIDSSVVAKVLPLYIAIRKRKGFLLRTATVRYY